MSYYLYQRQDSFSSSCMLHFKSTGDLKGQLMRRAKDSIILNTADWRAGPMRQAMGRVVGSDGSIGAEGRGKDDRTLAYALAYRGYDDWYRAPMSNNNQTFAIVRRARSGGRDQPTKPPIFRATSSKRRWRKRPTGSRKPPPTPRACGNFQSKKNQW